MDAVIDDQPRILVVDDELAIVRLIQRLLQRAGYHAAVALDTTEGARAFDEDGFDVVITDYRLQDGTAEVLFDHIGGRCPVIVLTGDAGAVEMPGAFAVAQKPLLQRELLRLVHEAQEQARALA